MFLNIPLSFTGFQADSYRAAQIAAMATPLVFVLASVRLFFDPRFAYGMGLFAGLIAVPWFVSMELPFFRYANSWIVLNLPDREDDGFILFSKLRILAVALIVAAIVWSALRLLPARWRLRNSPLCERTWPVFMVSFLVLAVWYGCAVIPYRIPIAVDGVSPQLTILHVEKKGIQFHEIGINVFRDGKFFISRNNRRLFQYRFRESGARGVTPPTVMPHVMALVQSAQLENLHTPPAKALRSWNADSWYLHAERSGILALTSEYGARPPAEMIGLFQEIEKLPATENWQGESKDVCLGFCYDPLAGLRFQFVNEHERCHTDENGTRCQ